MANEISASVSLTATKNGVSVGNSASRVATMAGDQMLSNVQIVGAVAEALVLGDVATVGYVLIKNLDATNYVEIALDAPCTAQVFCKVLAGDFALFPAKTATMYALANLAPCNVLVQAIEL